MMRRGRFDDAQGHPFFSLSFFLLLSSTSVYHHLDESMTCIPLTPFLILLLPYLFVPLNVEFCTVPHPESSRSGKQVVGRRPTSVVFEASFLPLFLLFLSSPVFARLLSGGPCSCSSWHALKRGVVADYKCKARMGASSSSSNLR
ncbi:hypothetical protein IWX90DRAFT_239168 [Phyllosticta citrichinensis]|uniref:Uncharacterized protein n=1 Tax=Phyllosticta citrichinensis TaxID=1130410 RepID=A0ABR1XQ56_9PEZI